MALSRDLLLQEKLQKLHKHRLRLIQRMLREQELAIGSVSIVKRKCGKPNCHCAQGEGHPQTLFLFRGDDGRRHCKLIRQSDSQQWLKAGDSYRRFQHNLKQLRTINKEEERILMALRELKAIYYK